MRLTPFVSLLLAAACPLAAQSSFIIPKKATVAAPGAVWFDSAPQLVLWGTADPALRGLRNQYIYVLSEVPIQSGRLFAIGVRPALNYGQQTGNYLTRIEISVSPLSHLQANTQFALNHGPQSSVVFQGQVNMPTINVTTWPPAMVPVAPFNQPYSFNSAGASSLVVDFDVSGASNNRVWMVEGYRDDAGLTTTDFENRSCLNSTGNRSTFPGWQPDHLHPGGQFMVDLTGYPVGMPSLATNALFFGVQGLGAPFGPFKTPFDLNAVVPSFPNCQWAIDIIGTGVPMQDVQFTTSAHLRLPSIPIPNLPLLVGSDFYTQGVALDVDATTGRSALWPSRSMKWTIGPGTPIPITQVERFYDSTMPTPPTGRIVKSHAATFEIFYN